MPHKGGGPYTLKAEADGIRAVQSAGHQPGRPRNIAAQYCDDAHRRHHNDSAGRRDHDNDSAGRGRRDHHNDSAGRRQHDHDNHRRQHHDHDHERCARCGRRWGMGSDAELEALRAFRDARLAKSAEGARLVGLYYRHAAELTAMFERRPEIAEQVRDLVLELLPQLGGQQKLALSHDMKQQMFDLIESCAPTHHRA